MCSWCMFCVCHHHATSTLLLLLLQTKAHIHTTQVKDPCTRRQCCSMGHLSVLLSCLKDASSCPDSPPPPFSMEGARLCCLTWISMWWAGVNCTPLVWNPLRGADMCTLHGKRDLDTVVSASLCIHPLTMPWSPLATLNRKCTRS